MMSEEKDGESRFSSTTEEETKDTGNIGSGWRRLVNGDFLEKTKKRISFTLLLLCFLSLVVIILIGVIGHERAAMQRKDGPPTVVSRLSDLKVNENLCTNRDCMRLAARLVENLNASVEPCENFYQFACGNYPSYNPVQFAPGGGASSSSVYSKLYSRNVGKLLHLMRQTPKSMGRRSARRKVNRFYSACIDDSVRGAYAGRALLRALLPRLGGWSLLGDDKWNATTWHFQSALEKVHGDFWDDAFFTFSLISNPQDPKQVAVKLHPAGIGRPFYYYNPRYSKYYLRGYKNQMRSLAGLLLRDSRIKMNESDIKDGLDQTVDDMIFVETNIAKIVFQTAKGRSALRAVTLADLNKRVGGAINWTSVFRYTFVDSGLDFNSGYTVFTDTLDYFQQIGQFLVNLNRTKGPEDAARILNNYLVWQVIHSHSKYLSYEYFDANRRYSSYKYRTTKGYDLRSACFHLTQRAFPIALGHMFISDHFADKSKPQIHKMVDSLKAVLKTNIKQLDWMDNSTKRIALYKVNSIVDKIAYPKFMENERKINYLYRTFTVSEHNHLGNMLGFNRYRANLFSRRLAAGYADEDEWDIVVYAVHLSMRTFLNELLVPAGLLQWPLFDTKLPGYLNYGSAGSLIGHELTRAVNEEGSFYRQTGKLKNWWSKASIGEYLARKPCFHDLLRNESVTLWDKYEYEFKKVKKLGYSTRFIITETGGVRYAYQAYQNWKVDNERTEKGLLGTGMDADKLFFVSFAQTYCNNQMDYQTALKLFRGRVPQQYLVNSVVSQLPEFSKTFQCTKGSTMNPDNQCKKIF